MNAKRVYMSKLTEIQDVEELVRASILPENWVETPGINFDLNPGEFNKYELLEMMNHKDEVSFMYELAGTEYFYYNDYVVGVERISTQLKEISYYTNRTVMVSTIEDFFEEVYGEILKDRVSGIDEVQDSKEQSNDNTNTDRVIKSDADVSNTKSDNEEEKDASGNMELYDPTASEKQD